MPIIENIKDMSPNENLIIHLERLLKKARAGEIRTIISICSWDDNSTTHGWAIDPRSSRRGLLAELVLLQNEYLIKNSLDDKDSVLSKKFEEWK